MLKGRLVSRGAQTLIVWTGPTGMIHPGTTFSANHWLGCVEYDCRQKRTPGLSEIEFQMVCTACLRTDS